MGKKKRGERKREQGERSWTANLPSFLNKVTNEEKTCVLLIEIKIKQKAFNCNSRVASRDHHFHSSSRQDDAVLALHLTHFNAIRDFRLQFLQYLQLSPRPFSSLLFSSPTRPGHDKK